MPKYRITAPDGKSYEVTAPEGATQADVLAYAQQQFSQQPKSQYQYDGSEYGSPLDGMSRTGKVILGADQAMTALGRGVKQLFTSDESETGKALQAQIDESKRLDAPLRADPYAIGGNIAANVATLAPTAFIPGANTILGSGAIGAVTGAMQPTASDESALEQAAVGGAFGAAGQAIGKAAPAVVKAIAAPFHQRGREGLAADAIKRFATNADDIARAAGTTSAVPGIQYSLAEATQDPGLAVLTRGVEALDPAIAGPLAQQNMGNIGAARNAINAIGGDDAAMVAAKESRESAANTLYGNAFKSDAMRRDIARQQATSAAPFAAVGGGGAVDDLSTPALRDLMDRPMFKQAADQARTLYRNKTGKDLGNPVESLEGLHYIKLALDDMAQPNAINPMGRNANAAVNDMRTRLAKELETVAPMYAAARETFKDLSRPINQMEIGRYLSDKMTPALAEADNAMLARTRAEAYAQALRGGDRTAKLATGFPAAKMADVMEPDQMQTLKGIEEYLARRAFAQEAGRGAGSNTAQNLASGNLMRQIMGPLGLPESWADSVMSQTVRRGVDLLAKPADAAIQRELAQALMNPQRAAQLLQQATPTQRQKIAQALYEKALTAAPVGVGAYATQQ